MAKNINGKRQNPNKAASTSVKAVLKRKLIGANKLDFSVLVSSIRQAHEFSVARAISTINISLTLRNWLIGQYIAEYELKGADRSKYGKNLLGELSLVLTKYSVSAASRRQLYGYLAFYRTYPQIVRSLTAQFEGLNLNKSKQVKKVRLLTAQSDVVGLDLVTKLTYTHFEQLVGIEDPIKRSFYEMECIRGTWSVKELKRQIGSLYFERLGLSRDKKKLAARVKSRAEKSDPKFSIRDPYVFEFLGIKSKDVMGESDVEDALLDKLQDFLVELGHGFCFEARQRRILIGSTYGFVDLVFYHRILKCHILIELKISGFKHEHLGQLNTYVSWFKRNMMTKGDNPPIGLLLCTDKDHALVQYALADLPNRLFVSKYQTELPTRKKIQAFLEMNFKEGYR